MALDPHKVVEHNFRSPDLPAGFGNVYYLGNASVGAEGSGASSDSNTGLDPLFPLATLANAMDQVSASREDVIVVLPGHAETITAQVDLDVIGVKIIGLGKGSLQPAFTVNGAIDLFDVSAADIRLENIKMTIATTDAATALINIDAAGFECVDCYMIPSVTSYNVVDCITITANGDDCLIDNLKILNKVVAVNSFINLEGAASNVIIQNCLMFGDVAQAAIIDAAKIDYLFLLNNNIAVVGSGKNVLELGSNPEGLAAHNFLAGTNTTLASNADYGNLMRLHQNYVTEETDASKQGVLSPAVDAD